MHTACKFPKWVVLLSLILSLSVPSPAEEWKLLPTTTASTTTQAATAKSGFLSRHVKFLTLDGYNHFRCVDTNPGTIVTRDLFYKMSTTLRITLAGEATTYLQARGESGCSFAASFDYTSVGMNKRNWSFNLKSLFLGQKIGSHRMLR